MRKLSDDGIKVLLDSIFIIADGEVKAQVSPMIEIKDARERRMLLIPGSHVLFHPVLASAAAAG